ncbi:TauD/TfdA family dioxygenase [Sorangium sp. So ce854]|uniref:TauD/TfdA family dioxygenase n=1 Tax=Sorangium sp. So ce854 TaxID=3133322 RepID=UPI003F5F9D49
MSERWIWPGAEQGPARLLDELAARGFSVLRGDTAALAPEEAARAPWSFAERLLGARPRLVERQPIKAVPGGRSFAASSAAAPLHTDSQRFAGAPPAVQIMACVRPAERGGGCLLLDGWALLATVERADPGLFRALFTVYRRIPFVFGDFYGPTVSLRDGALAFTHAPVVPPGDAIAARLARFVEASQRELIELSLGAGDILVVDNRRMLHGRRAFEGGPRELVRLLAWTEAALPSPPAYRAVAAQVAEAASRRLAGAPEATRRRLGLGAPAPPEARRRLGFILEMLRGVPPGVLAARERIPEPELYRLRDVALAAAEAALAGEAGGADDGALAEAIAWMSALDASCAPRRGR